MAVYELVKDYGMYDGLISTSPAWVLHFVRFSEVVTYDHTKTNKGDRSLFQGAAMATAENEPLTIMSGCRALSTVSDKSSHISGMSASLYPDPDGREWLGEINAGDWVMAWIVNSEEEGVKLYNKLQAGQQCNEFMSGLKFIGRVNSLRQMTEVDPASGTVVRYYNLTANGFTELDSRIIYYRELEDNFLREKWGGWLQRLGVLLDKVNYDAFHNSAGQIDPNKFIPELLNTLLGKGLNKDAVYPNTDQSEEIRYTPNPDSIGYLVPSSVGKILGRTARVNNTGLLTFLDIADLYIGVQHFKSGILNDWTGVIPNNCFGPLDPGSVWKTSSPLAGAFMVNPEPYANNSVWEIMTNFLNPAINEMFTSLKTNIGGTITPQIIVRQKPFSTMLHNNPGGGDIEDMTLYTELPRWKATYEMVISSNLGYTDSARCNCVFIRGIAPGVAQNPEWQLINNAPIRIDTDIYRNGLRMIHDSVSCSREDAALNVWAWTHHVSDFLVDAQLQWNGSVDMVGVQAPIAVGDAFELDEVVYQIETVTHNCQMSPDGVKRFTTHLQLTQGMSNETLYQRAEGAMNANEAIYPGLAKRAKIKRISFEGSKGVKEYNG